MIEKCEWYRKKGSTPMRPYMPGENLIGVSVSDENMPPKEGGMIAYDPTNPVDQWYISKAYFEEHYEAVR